MAGKVLGMVVLAVACSTSVLTSGEIVLSPSTSQLTLQRYATLNLTCESDRPITWHRNNVKMNIISKTGFVQTAETHKMKHGTKMTSKLWKVGVDTDDSGIYSCHDLDQPHLQAQIDIRVRHGQNPMILPDVTPLWVLAPGAINLSCIADGEATITWLKDDNPLSGSRYNISFDKKGSNGAAKTTYTLIVLNPTAADAGHYKCKIDGGNQESTRPVKVLEVAVTSANYTKGETAVLRCDPVNMPPDLGKKSHFTWNQNNAPLLTDDRYKVDKENYTLEISKPVRKDSGQYECVFSFEVSGDKIVKLVQPVDLFAAPLVDKFDRSKNMVQGDTLKLKCFVTGHPSPIIVWRRDGVEIDVSEDRISIKDIKEGETVVSKGGLLQIYELQFEDRASYQCEANNTFGSDNSVILVRVKDKLAALWPFLGIVAEVIILCTIIFIYEKRRSKDTDDEEDAPLQKTANAQDNKGKDEVRQRKP